MLSYKSHPLITVAAFTIRVLIVIMDELNGYSLTYKDNFIYLENGCTVEKGVVLPSSLASK